MEVEDRNALPLPQVVLCDREEFLSSLLRFVDSAAALGGRRRKAKAFDSSVVVVLL